MQPKLAPRDVQAVVENAILRQRDRVHVHDPEHRAAQHRQDRVRHRVTRRADRFLVRGRRVQNAVADRDRNRIRLHFVLVDLNRTKNAVLDADVRANVVKLQTRFAVAHRSAITFQLPARHERAMANQDLRAANRIARIAGLDRAPARETAPRGP